MRKLIVAVATVVFLLALGACTGTQNDLVLEDIAPPAAADSMAPSFARSPDGGIYLSWLENDGNFSRLMFSRWLGEGWSDKGVVAQGRDWFVNWADFPTLIALSDQRLMAQWLVRSGPGTYAYDVHLGQSLDGGRTWSELGVLHNDGIRAEHGFVAFYPDHSNGSAEAGAVWLDGRNLSTSSGDGHAGGHGDGHGDKESGMSLRHARLNAAGAVVERTELDAFTCDCCQTAAVAIGDDVLVAYRDREMRRTGDGEVKEIRDIMLLRRTGETWLKQGYVNADNWEITGCPVNGPAMAADQQRVAIAWYTEAAGEPVVRAGISSDGGFRFHTFDVSDDQPMGRVGITLLDSAVAVSWLARVGDAAEIRMRLFGYSGEALLKVQRLAVSEAGRSAGFPQLTAANGSLLLAWTEAPGSTRPHTRVRARRIRFKSPR